MPDGRGILFNELICPVAAAEQQISDQRLDDVGKCDYNKGGMYLKPDNVHQQIRERSDEKAHENTVEQHGDENFSTRAQREVRAVAEGGERRCRSGDYYHKGRERAHLVCRIVNARKEGRECDEQSAYHYRASH